MTWQKEIKQLLRSRALIDNAIIGAGMAFILVLILLLGGSNNGIDFTLWMLLPMFAGAIGGAVSGAIYFLMAPLRKQGGWQKLVAIVTSGSVYLVISYMSLILALNAIGLWH